MQLVSESSYHISSFCSSGLWQNQPHRMINSKRIYFHRRKSFTVTEHGRTYSTTKGWKRQGKVPEQWKAAMAHPGKFDE
jgi:hypothetical protein